MSHVPHYTGAGYWCHKCEQSWDQGDEPGACIDDPVQPLGVPDMASMGMKIIGEIPSRPPQIGGNQHYDRLAIDPITFAMVNGWDSCAFSILKYLSRWRHKNGVEDLRKARSFVIIRQRFPADLPRRLVTKSMIDYCAANGIVGADRDALYALERWVMMSTGSIDILGEIDRLIEIGA